MFLLLLAKERSGEGAEGRAAGGQEGQELLKFFICVQLHHQ